MDSGIAVDNSLTHVSMVGEILLIDWYFFAPFVRELYSPSLLVSIRLFVFMCFVDC